MIAASIRRVQVNKQELITSIADKASMTKADAARALDATLASVSEALEQGDTVTLVGFGSFYVGDRAARTGRNPRTGKNIKIKAAKVPKFRAGKGLKDAVN
ncbi:HU family DNA-binding protein [Thauera mechernichensis]|uniref:HU family DNA-binding protein n=1 Tax=Thauera mechernichensis TaxID=82788 RepID=A0ABW3WF11_9RHOO|nr:MULTISPECIES: HU family DNA-binding protein [Thauera]HNR60064.1 HU family DNA-binding protein [Thauera sp.]MDG3064777.1 HU family DNA-binding protein [Thauera mechernichensis]HNS91904.1 HU family DNA-binding protein [Thauera sp.]HRJ22981.1 HU family DNA-binding protein [Thauera sp.]HRK10612.1 HU family DNA-binding protein [Thauera sp.]